MCSRRGRTLALFKHLYIVEPTSKLGNSSVVFVEICSGFSIGAPGRGSNLLSLVLNR
jgi:hypothetical protein